MTSTCPRWCWRAPGHDGLHTDRIEVPLEHGTLTLALVSARDSDEPWPMIVLNDGKQKCGLRLEWEDVRNLADTMIRAHLRHSEYPATIAGDN